MKYSEFLVPEACVELTARTKDEALGELATALADGVTGLDRLELLKLLQQREHLGTTGMGDGIAIPHAWIDELDRIVAGFCRSYDGVEFGALDGTPSHLFFVIAAPPSSRGVYLQLVSQLAAELRLAETRSRLMEANTLEELLAVFDF